MLRLGLEDSERVEFARFVLGVCVMVVVWAVFHDAHLMGVEPRHFRVFHDPLLAIENDVMFAAQYAMVATTGPGMLLGGLGFVVCRLGRRKRLGMGAMVVGLVGGLWVLEVVCRGIGRMSVGRFLKGEELVYPSEWYAELSEGMVYTQTVNVTGYLGGAAVGLCLLTGLWCVRVWRNT